MTGGVTDTTWLVSAGAPTIMKDPKLYYPGTIGQLRYYPGEEGDAIAVQT